MSCMCVHVRSVLSMAFSRQEYQSGLPFPSWGDPLDPGTEPVSLGSPTLAGGFWASWEAQTSYEYRHLETRPTLSKWRCWVAAATCWWPLELGWGACWRGCPPCAEVQGLPSHLPGTASWLHNCHRNSVRRECSQGELVGSFGYNAVSFGCTAKWFFFFFLQIIFHIGY